MQLSFFKTTLMMSAITVMTVSCDRDDEIHVRNPAYHIHQSEKLSIPSAVDLPANAPKGNSRVATYFAVGVQKYKAQQKPGTDPGVYEWAFVAPKADLYDKTNHKVGTHSAGPVWQLDNGGGTIYAHAFAPPRSAPAASAYSIDWLLLKTKDGTVPTGAFSNVAYIQRIATQGGKAPSFAPQSATDTIDVQYTAIYRFSKIN